MNNHLSKNKPAVIFSIIIISVISCFFNLLNLYEISPIQANKTTISYSKIEDILYPDNTVSIPKNKITYADAPIQTISPSQSIPILMYHHIRNYNKANDKIGTNLSVSPENFKAQLDLIYSMGYQTTTFEEINKGIFYPKPIILTFDDGYKNFYAEAYPELKNRQMKAVVSIIANAQSDQYLNNSEIKEISEYGIEISSHTLSHLDLSRAASDKVYSEINDSKILLENIIGKKLISFCYPAGKYNDETKNIVKNSGYLFATTTKTGLTNFDDPFELKRYRVNKDTNISKFIK